MIALVCRSASEAFVEQRQSKWRSMIDDVPLAEGADRCGGAIGLVCMALSALSFSVMTLFVHILERQGA